MVESVLHLDFETYFRGTQNQLLLLHEGLLDVGVRSFVLAAKGGEMAARGKKKELPHLYEARRIPFAFGDFDPWLILATIQASRRMKPQIIHAHGGHACGVLFFAKPFLPKETVILFHRTVSNPARSKSKYAAADATIVVCGAIRDDLASKGVNPESIYVIASGVPMGGCEGERERGRVGERGRDGEIVIGSLSALDKDQKDVATLIRAFSLAAPKISGSKLLIFGDGPDRPALEALTRELGLTGRVEFRGWWTRPMEEAFAEMDIFALPSLFEGTSNVLITALYCGIPSVATEIGGNPEVLGDAGLLVPAKNARAMADALERLALDPALRKSLSEKARRRAPEFSSENTLRKTLACYDSVLKRFAR